MITAKEAAAALNGNEYGDEGSTELFAKMKEARLVAVHGYSDDIMVLNGAVHDEAYHDARFTKDGLLENKCEDNHCPYFEIVAESASVVEALWDKEPGIAWTYRTKIPHETFLIMEGDEIYCRGIVFSLDDCT